RLTSGRTIRYALGVSVNDYRGIEEGSHSGATAGYSTYLLRFPDRANTSVAVLCNFSGAPTWTLAHRVADHLVKDFPAAVAPDTARMDPASLTRFFGVYMNTRDHSTYTVNAEAAAQIRALPNGWYWYPNGDQLFFDVNSAGAPVDMRLAD